MQTHNWAPLGKVHARSVLFRSGAVRLSVMIGQVLLSAQANSYKRPNYEAKHCLTMSGDHLNTARPPGSSDAVSWQSITCDRPSLQCGD